ncbi:probable serine/threonine-protein kinase At1g54610 isoform X2 [Cornus florida]|uniref:probable serine/threonine-protein kinase At1g54610 isoform X2 n=1 Tax=Cornus florida TaxID=4283 RepID=UPI0028A1752A|nr:probable serine/threonine-protein kinase At1g54610 isoform X2 [Cornus florida]
MGCLCGKASAVKDSRESPIEIQQNKVSSELHVPRVASSRRRESFRVKGRSDSGDVRLGLIKRANGSRRVQDDRFEKKRDNYEVLVAEYPGMGSLPRATEGEQVAAGWPSWLAAAAGEAIKGWLPRRADTFEKLDKIGQGTYSSVYKARDLTQKKVVALKRVRFDNLDPESVKFMAREILLLRRLDHPNIIKLEGLVTSRTSCSLYLVFEYMEHDLTGLTSLPGIKFTEPQIKCYMQQLLSGLDYCHSHGILHRDIKGSNLLIDNHGILKIADFGLASFFDHRQGLPLTSRVVTLWYRPPELLLGATYYGVSVDLWSTGCILGELYAGKPIMPGRTEVEQLHKIFKLCGSPSDDYWRKSKLPHSTVFKPVQPYKRRLAETFKDFPPTAIGLMEKLLSIDPAHRGTAASALKNEFFTTKPFACDPSSLPKYPPSKEIDAKLRDEEARRRGTVGGREQKVDKERGLKGPRAISVADANAELATSMQRRQGQPNTKSRSEVFNPHQEEAASGFPLDPPRHTQDVREVGKDLLDHIPKRAMHSGPLVPGFGWPKAGKKYDDISIVSTRADLSTLSDLVSSRTSLSEESHDKLGPSQPEATNQVGMLSESYRESGPTRKQDRKHHTQSIAGSRQMEYGRTSMKEPVPHGHGKANNIHFSGPLLVPSNNVDQMLKEHDRRIQEAARRARLEKTKPGKFQPQGMQIANQMYISSRGAG